MVRLLRDFVHLIALSVQHDRSCIETFCGQLLPKQFDAWKTAKIANNHGKAFRCRATNAI